MPDYRGLRLNCVGPGLPGAPGQEDEAEGGQSQSACVGSSLVPASITFVPASTTFVWWLHDFLGGLCDLLCANA